MYVIHRVDVHSSSEVCSSTAINSSTVTMFCDYVILNDVISYIV